jgi:hypothetical protein
MRVTVTYAVDDTTAVDVFTGTKISSQIFPDGRGNVIVFDPAGARISDKLYRKVYTIERIFAVDDPDAADQPAETPEAPIDMGFLSLPPEIQQSAEAEAARLEQSREPG